VAEFHERVDESPASSGLGHGARDGMTRVVHGFLQTERTPEGL
jgi:hypothetical protein